MQKRKDSADFIRKLQDMIQNFSDAIHWQQDGKTIKIQSKEQLQNKVLPLYFRHNNIGSFIRQLNLYQFKKITNTNSQCYQHNIFRKGNQHLFHRIHRKMTKKSHSVKLIGQEKEKIEIQNPVHNLMRKLVSFKHLSNRKIQNMRNIFQVLQNQLSKVKSHRVKCLMQNTLKCFKEIQDSSEKVNIHYQNFLQECNKENSPKKNIIIKDSQKVDFFSDKGDQDHIPSLLRSYSNENNSKSLEKDIKEEIISNEAN